MVGTGRLPVNGLGICTAHATPRIFPRALPLPALTLPSWHPNHSGE